MIMRTLFGETKEKRRLRYGVIVLMLLSVAMLEVNERTFSRASVSAYEHLANVAAMSASVEQNPYNTLAMELSAKEGELLAREEELREREALLERKIDDAARSNKQLTLFVLSGVTLLLLLLIFLNFYFDIKREESREHAEAEDKEGDLTTRL